MLSTPINEIEVLIFIWVCIRIYGSNLAKCVCIYIWYIDSKIISPPYSNYYYELTLGVIAYQGSFVMKDVIKFCLYLVSTYLVKYKMFTLKHDEQYYNFQAK